MTYKHLLSTLLLATLSNITHANLIDNGDFENGSFPDWINSGNVAINTEAQLQIGGFAVGSFPSGTHAANFNGGNLPITGTLSQEFDTTVGGSYTLDFDFGRFGTGSGGAQGLNIEILDVAANQVLLSQNVVDTTGTLDLAVLKFPRNWSLPSQATIRSSVATNEFWRGMSS